MGKAIAMSSLDHESLTQRLEELNAALHAEQMSFLSLPRLRRLGAKQKMNDIEIEIDKARQQLELAGPESVDETESNDFGPDDIDHAERTAERTKAFAASQEALLSAQSSMKSQPLTRKREDGAGGTVAQLITIAQQKQHEALQARRHHAEALREEANALRIRSGETDLLPPLPEEESKKGCRTGGFLKIKAKLASSKSILRLAANAADPAAVEDVVWFLHEACSSGGESYSAVGVGVKSDEMGPVEVPLVKAAFSRLLRFDLSHIPDDHPEMACFTGATRQEFGELITTMVSSFTMGCLGQALVGTRTLDESFRQAAGADGGLRTGVLVQWDEQQRGRRS